MDPFTVKEIAEVATQNSEVPQFDTRNISKSEVKIDEGLDNLEDDIPDFKYSAEDKSECVKQNDNPASEDDPLDAEKNLELASAKTAELDNVANEQDVSNDYEGKISYEIHTRNESLDGDNHPITGVPFEKKTVEDADGNEVTGVFPKFDSKFDAQLPENKLQASDNEQFTECNSQLNDAVENDSGLAKQFTPEQLEQIKNGDTPDGYTWHHNEEKGKMQLVDAEPHAQTGHTGGRSIWGGGTENR